MRIRAVAALVLALMQCTPAAGGERSRITVAVLPCSDEVSTVTKFSPLMRYLAEETGFAFEIVVPGSTVDFDHLVRSGGFSFALQDPNTYVAHAASFQSARLLTALNPAGEAVQEGVLIARKDRGINCVEDLRGKSVMFGNELSATKWVAARDLLQEHGIAVDKDLRSHTVGGCCEDIAFNVYLGAVDAGVVCAHFLPAHPEKQEELGVHTQALVVVGRTHPVPERVFAAHRVTDPAVVEKVVQALLKLDRSNPAHALVLSRAELGGFRRAADRDYDGMRKLIGGGQRPADRD